MEELYSPKRHQTRLANKRNSGAGDEISESTNSKYTEPRRIERGLSESAFALPIERVWTHNSYILRTSRKNDTDQILLDQLSLSAEEVRDTKSFEKRFIFLRGPLTSYNSIRETLHLLKESRRQKDLSAFEQVYKSPILFMTKLLLAIRTFFRSSKRVLFVTIVDFFVDFIFCVTYLVEVSYDLAKVDDYPYIQGLPEYFRVYRTNGLMTVIFCCAVWNLLSWIGRMVYVRVLI